MTSSKPFRAKAITSLLVVAVLQLFVLASPASAAGNANMVYGRLSVTGDTSVLLNGNAANSGTTIFSGSRVQTAEAGASIQLGTVGRVEMEPNTDLTLTFDKENVDVKVAKGNAFLSTATDVRGSITAPDGTTTAAGDPSMPKKKGGGLSSGAKAGIIVGVVVGTVLIIYFATRNSSP